MSYRLQVQIAQLLGVSVRTVRRRMSGFDLSVRSTYSQMSDNQLDEVVGKIQQQYGHLLSRGIRIQFHRVRESQSRIDPEGTVLRRLKTLKRRRHGVKGPQHLWHIDGHHKLIRYNSDVHVTTRV